MKEQLLGAFLISLLHGLIPSHWLPILSIGQQHAWSQRKTLWIAFQLAMAHAISTIMIGVLIATQSHWLHTISPQWFKWMPAIILMGLGVWFLYRHHKHHHFHINPTLASGNFSIFPLLLAMFLSPCLEIEGFYFSMVKEGWFWIAVLSVVYLITTLISMLLWIWLAYRGLEKINAHRWTHSSGIITGIVLIVSGILFLLD